MNKKKVQKKVDGFTNELSEMGIRDAIIIVGLKKNYYIVARLYNPKTRKKEIAKFIDKIWNRL